VKINDDDIAEVLISGDKISSRLSELAAEIDEHYAGIDDELVVLGVLNGAAFVLSDFSKCLKTSAVIDFMSLSSYGSGTKSSGVVRILKDLSIDIKGRDVLIVEDILDSGLTLAWLVNNLRTRGVKSVEVVTLLRKTLSGSKSTGRVTPRWVGFEIPDVFVVGFGLDYDGRYRTLPFVGVLAPSVYE
jgi:hypoxanthine phosphoribosyltransferase